jgi:hypothetical protein
VYDRFSDLSRFLALNLMCRNHLLKVNGLEPTDNPIKEIPSMVEQVAKVISESGLFDPDHYLDSNPDVCESGMDPLRHYLISGCVEGGNPSLWFNTRHHLLENIEKDPAMWNPLLSHIKRGGGRIPGSNEE